ncbi:MAG: lipid II flippase MurJ [Betaproteobacteria bacterium]
MTRLPAALLVISVATILSGYLRELALAVVWGAGPLTDAFFVALSVPMVIADLVIGSALTAMVVPVFTRMGPAPGNGSPQATELFCALLTTVGIAGVAVGAAAMACAEPLIEFLGPGLDLAGQRTATRYLYWLIWLVPLNGFVVLACQTLNAMRIFVTPACAGLIVNLVFVVGVMGVGGAPSLAVAALAGPVIVSVLLLRALARIGISAPCRPRFRSPWFREARALAAPMAATVGIGSGLGLVMISHLVLRRFGSEMGDGVISALTYAFRIYQVPMTVVISTVGVLVAPAFAQLMRAGRQDAVRENCQELLNWGLLILIPISVVLHTQADLVVRILFEYGRFDTDSVHMTAELLRGMALAIPFEAVLITFLRIIQTLGRPGTTAAIGVLTVLALIVPLALGFGRADLASLPYALVIALGLGAAACLFCVSLILKKPVFPSFKEFTVSVVLGCGLSAILTSWESQNVAGSIAWSLGGMLAWTASYVLLAAFALPVRRRAIAKWLHTR